MSHFQYQQISLTNGSRWTVAKVNLNFTNSEFKRAQTQAKLKSVYTMNASQAGGARSPEMKYQRQLMGCLAEIYVQEYLKEKINENGLQSTWSVIRYDDIRTDGFKSAANEYDIQLRKTDNSSTFYVESRSSIAKDRTISKALEDFDIIGPYSSITKGSERYNDLYLRPLYAYNGYMSSKYSDLNFEHLLINGSIELYIVAGCFKEDMINKGYNKSMGQGNTQYRVIKILDGYDAQSFKNELSRKL